MVSLEFRRRESRPLYRCGRQRGEKIPASFPTRPRRVQCEQSSHESSTGRMAMKRTAWLAAAVVASMTALLIAEEQTLKYPQTRRGDQVDDYHGTKVADPFRWLEEDVRTSKEVAEWVEAQNKVTFAYLEAIPE